MFYYNFYYKEILINYFNNFNKNFINYFTGLFNENEFKVFRLQFGIYRQKKSYMLRFSVLCGKLNFFQLIIFSYISLKYDKNYFHFTTRTNIQLNWVKIFDIYEIFKIINFLLLDSIQSSGNCVRNITSSLTNGLLSNPWSELIRQWFGFNSEFLFLPRKFKICFLFSKNDNIAFKTHDLGFYMKKNCFNNIIINILVGGGMGRTPIIGLYILKNVHWKNILNYSDKILRIYNTYGFRNNIYKSRLKILIKSLNLKYFLNFIYKEFNYSNKYIYFLNEKEVNFFFNKKLKFDKNFFKKNITFNYFFLNWLKKCYKESFVYLPLKNNNTPPGDINYIQVKILYFFFNNLKLLKIFNRQNLIFLNIKKIYFMYLKLKMYFFNIYNTNTLTDIICCPGGDYCVLANAKSIIITNIIQNIFNNFNSILKIDNLFLNISGCVNSCGHHHISNIGFLGVNKNNKNYYQLYIKGVFNNYNSLTFSKVFSSAFELFRVSYIFIKIIRNFLLVKISNFIRV